MKLAACLIIILATDCGSKVRLFGQSATANCAAPPTASAGQYATLHCKPLLFWFPCKRRYINVETMFVTPKVIATFYLTILTLHFITISLLVELFNLHFTLYGASELRMGGMI